MLLLGKPAAATTDIFAGLTYNATNANTPGTWACDNSDLSGNPVTNWNDGSDSTVGIRLGVESKHCYLHPTSPTSLGSVRASMPCSYFPSSDPGHLYTAYSYYNRGGLIITPRVQGTNTDCSIGCVDSDWTDITGSEFVWPSTSSTSNCGTVSNSVTANAGPWAYFRLLLGNAYQSGCSGYCGGAMATYNLYEGVTTASIGEYMVNMSVGHPAFQWTASWDWAQTWHGSFVVATSSAAADYYTKDSGGTLLTASHVYTSYTAVGGSAQRPYFHQDCHPLCASAEFTVIINDTDRNQTATFTFLRSADGAVGPTTRAPRIVYIVPCFNLTANQCGHGSGVNTLDLAWKWVGSNAKLEVGPQLPTGAFEAVAYLDADETEGAYAQLAIPVNTAQSALWQMRLTNRIGDVRLVTFRLPLGTGGAGENFNSTDPRDSASGGCAQAATPVIGGLLCGLQDIFAVSAADLRQKIAETVGDCDQQGGSCTGLIGTAMSRQPFNFIARSLQGVSTQLTRATAAFSSTATCPGFEVSLPWAMWVPAAYRPTGDPLTFYLLRCADFEPFVSTSWYQAIRTAMDPALFLGYAYAWMRRLQPRPGLSG